MKCVERQFAESNHLAKDFALKYRLKTKLLRFDKLCSEVVISGKSGEIFHYGFWPGETSDRIMGVMFMPDGDGKRPAGHRWTFHRAAMVKAGFIIAMDCDGEGIGRFNPDNHAQVQVALKVAGVFPKRRSSNASTQVKSAALAGLRNLKNPV